MFGLFRFGHFHCSVIQDISVENNNSMYIYIYFFVLCVFGRFISVSDKRLLPVTNDVCLFFLNLGTSVLTWSGRNNELECLLLVQTHCNTSYTVTSVWSCVCIHTRRHTMYWECRIYSWAVKCQLTKKWALPLLTPRLVCTLVFWLLYFSAGAQALASNYLGMNVKTCV